MSDERDELRVVLNAIDEVYCSIQDNDTLPKAVKAAVYTELDNAHDALEAAIYQVAHPPT